MTKVNVKKMSTTIYPIGELMFGSYFIFEDDLYIKTLRGNLTSDENICLSRKLEDGSCRCFKNSTKVEMPEKVDICYK